MYPPPWRYIANPPPRIKYLSPYAAAEGSSDVKVILEGEDFLDGSRVQFAGQDIKGKPVRSTQIQGTDYLPYYRQLEVIIPAKLLKKAGLYSIQVINPRPKGGVSNEGYFVLRFS